MVNGIVMAEEPWRLQPHPLWTSCDLNDLVTGLQSRQQNELISVPNSCNVTAEVAYPGPSVSVFPKLDLGQSNEFHRSSPSSPPLLGSSHLCTVSLTKESWSAISNGIGVEAKPNTVSACSQKKLHIFDRYGNQTRYVVGPFLSFPLHNQIAVHKMPLDACNMHNGIVENEMVSAMNLINLEEVDENSIIDEECEMHEDTEEINALLYSDDSDEDHDCTDGDTDGDSGGDDDEVTSTGHSPVEIGGVYDKCGKVSEDADKVASSDGSNKRQKLIDGRYTNSPLMDSANTVKLGRSSNYCDVLESSSAVQKSLGKGMDLFSSECGKKLKIREILKVLEKLVPGLEGRDSLQILDGAIDYLKSLRLKAETNWS